MRVRIDGELRVIRPGAAGGYVTVYRGLRDLSGGTVSTVVDGRRVAEKLG